MSDFHPRRTEDYTKLGENFNSVVSQEWVNRLTCILGEVLRSVGERYSAVPQDLASGLDTRK